MLIFISDQPLAAVFINDICPNSRIIHLLPNSFSTMNIAEKELIFLYHLLPDSLSILLELIFHLVEKN